MSLGSLPSRLSWNSSPGSCVLHWGRPLISMGWEGSWPLSMCSFPHVPRSWPIPCAAGPCFPPEVALTAGFLSASSPHAVTARQAPSGEKWNWLSGEIQATARKVPVHHPSERCCPLGLEPTHVAEGSTVSSKPGEPQPHLQTALPAS